MVDQIRYDETPPARADREESALWPGQKMGVPLVSEQYRHIEAIAPSGALLAQPTDGVMLSAAGNVTATSVDDPTATPFVLALLAGVVYPFALAKVTVVSAGTLFALHHRKPSEP